LSPLDVELTKPSMMCI